MSLTPSVNQNAATINFNEITYGAEPAVLQQVNLNSGFTYLPMGSLIGTPKASPGSSFFLFNQTDNTQMLWGITYDKFLNTVDFAASLAPFTFTGSISNGVGNISTITAGNIAASTGLNPNPALSVITGLSIGSSTLTLGARITGTGIPAGATIVQVLSSSAIVITGNVTVATPTFTGDTTSGSATIANTSINTNTLVVGAPISGAGIPVGATIASIVSANSITISANATATATGVTLTSNQRIAVPTLTSYAVSSSNSLISVATVQGNTTEWIQSALVGVNGATDISNYVTSNPTLARSFNRYNGSTAIPVVTFTFMGGN